MNKSMLLGMVGGALAASTLINSAMAAEDDKFKATADRPVPPKRLTAETPSEKAQRLAWWQHDRFGMFIHFGLYSALGRHEWVKSNEYIADKDYDEKYVKYFNPDLFDAKEWARAAKKAGMKYMVLTTKHHEGFCMWDTKTTDFKITNTAFKRDLVREYVEACRAEGLKVGFYFSLMDWHCPDYLVDPPHPLCQQLRWGPKRYAWDDPKLGEEVAKLNEGRDMNKFREMMFAQVKELLTDYGKIDIVWFDYTPRSNGVVRGKTWKDWEAVELVKLAKKLQPGIILDNRTDLLDTEDGWDFITPEQHKVQSAPRLNGKPAPWETCQTFSGSWGYYRDEKTWKSAEQLIELLTETVSKGGNLILNVGPTGRGDFDYRAKDRLAAFENWMHFNARSVYGCGPAPEGFIAPNGTSLTYNKDTNVLYIHLDDYPMGLLPINFFDKVAHAQFLHDGSELLLAPPPVRHAQDGEQENVYGSIKLPIEKPNILAPVIECFLK